ncbi:hypothetical protein JCM11641_001457 [Rhodosporidiobolus odoratus]
MVRRHSGSLMPKQAHNAALLQLMRSPLTDEMVAHIVEKTVEAVKCRPPPSSLPTPPLTPGSSPSSDDTLPPLDEFIKSIVKKSKCHVPTLLCTLVYLERLRQRLPSHARGCHTTRHRVFLATLIVVAKYLNDSSPQNKHWCRYAVHFNPAEINLMERQLLTIFNFDLRFTEDELMLHLGPLLEPYTAAGASTCCPPQPRTSILPVSSASPKAINFAEESPAPTTHPLQEVQLDNFVNPVFRPDSHRQDEVISRQPYHARSYTESPSTSPRSQPKRLTPPYRIAASHGPLGPYHHTPPSSYVQPHHGAPVASLSVLGRPPLRTETSYSSLISNNSHGSWPPSWYPNSTSPSLGRSGDSHRSSVSPAHASGNRTSRLSSHSSTSTLSSVDSVGPRTPSPPLPLQRTSTQPFQQQHQPRHSRSSVHLTRPEAAYRIQHPHHHRDPSYAPPSPSLIHALAHDPDLWPIMSTSATYAKQERLVRGEMRVSDAKARESQGRLGLNLRAGERHEGVWDMGAR